MRLDRLTSLAALLGGPALAVIIAVAPAPARSRAEPITFSFDTSHSRVGFQVKHLGLTTVSGRFTKYAGSFTFDSAKVDASSADVTIDAASVDTDNERRDADLRSENFFDVAKFPTLRFVSTRAEAVDATHFKLTGNLTIKDTTKPVTLDVTLNGMVPGRAGTRVSSFNATTTIKRQDFGLLYNRLMEGIAIVADDVRIVIDIEARSAAAAPK